MVPRKAGWDTHGLPVELEVEKKLGLDGKEQIEAYGMEPFIQQCKESVWKYKGMWEDFSSTVGFWADMDHPYVTYDDNYIESEWWALKEIWNKNLLYKGFKIVPYCPRCGTPLSAQEVSQGYKTVKERSAIVRFKVVGEEAYFLAWTTTPWTLPSNVALCVNPDETYCKVKAADGYTYYLAEALMDKVLGKLAKEDEKAYEILETYKGKDLEYKEYEPLWECTREAAAKQKKKAHFVVCDSYVTMSDGTGIVHIAPAFGEDDNRVGRDYNLPFVQFVDGQGNMAKETPYAGVFVKKADPLVLVDLDKEGKLFDAPKFEHDYPHCWRCGTPLVYYAKPSWYIEMSKLKDQLVENNNTVNWYPPFVGEKRFGNWLAEVKDWAISRSRYWGTPIPIWRCECGHLECIGSREELKEKGVEAVDPETIDLHRPYVDNIHLTCPECGKTMTRIPEVMDCWFDSGVMPYAQWHYPFENKERFEKELFPADFICEGIDQTRGWFYSLMAISTFIMGRAPYKNVLVNDLILDKEGKKMSKSRGNTVSPFELLDKYGADALRWYLVSTSPAWTPTRFDEDGVKEVVSKFFGTLKNIYNFFVLYSNLEDLDVASLQVPYENRPELDRWIISRYNKCIREATAALDSYEHMRMVRTINDFVVEDLSNWYIRRARRRFYTEEMDEDKKSVFATTYEILVGVAKLIAPIAPFISDEMYIKLTGKETVHTAYYPEADENLIDEKVEERMGLVKTLVNLGRGTREKEKLKVRQPLQEVIIDGSYESIISDLVPLIQEELNVKNVVFEPELDKYMNFSIKPNFREAGKALGKNVKEFGKKLAECDAKKLIAEVQGGSVTMNLGGEDYEIPENYLDVRISAKEGFVVGMENNVFTILETTLTPELIDEGYVREIISKVQQLRKQHDFEMMDHIRIYLAADEEIQNAVNGAKDHIMSETLADEIVAKEGIEVFDINGHDTGIAVERV